jgi:multidrug efflux system outer membrane protein
MRRLAALLAFVACGCAVGPHYKRPPVVVPERFYGQPDAATAEDVASAPWWDVFGDPTLRSLVDEALAKGYDARIAAARVEEARARYGIAGSAFYPQLDYQAQITSGHTSHFATPADKTGTVGTANITVAWELDLWGRLRRLNESARAQYLATEEARRGVLLSLVADVATTYFEMRELDDELAIARRSAAELGDAYELFHKRLEGGAASALETSRAEAVLAGVRAQVPLLERDVVQKENRLALLLGRNPGPIPRGLDLAAQPAPPSIPVGLPSTLLARRPDLRQAEQLLISANANVGAADAALLPTISLTGLAGSITPQLSELLGEGKTWNASAGLLGPLFHGGRLRQQRRVAIAQWEEARLTYEHAVINAFGDVSTQLVALQKLTAAEAERAHAVTANQEAVRLSNLRYTSGFSAYFEVLDALQQLLITQNQLAQTRRDRLVALANLYKALGGGWPIERPAASE